MKKVDVTSRTIWLWGCPECGCKNTEEAYSVVDLDLVCELCAKEFELGEVFEDV